MTTKAFKRSSTSISALPGVTWPLVVAVAAEIGRDSKTVARAARELAGVGPAVRGRAGEAARAALRARGLPKAVGQ